MKETEKMVLLFKSKRKKVCKKDCIDICRSYRRSLLQDYLIPKKPEDADETENYEQEEIESEETDEDEN